MTNSSSSEQFESAYRRLWMALHRGDDPDLSQHERSLLHHVPAADDPDRGGIALNDLAAHLGLPKSSASVLVKDLERRGFLVRRRHPDDERRLAIVLTTLGRRRVAEDSVLEPRHLASALAALNERDRAALVRTMQRLANAAEATNPSDGPTP
jgi:DNA-binding MarR family transcriptional regulator